VVVKVGGENTNDNQAKEYFRENKEISKENGLRTGWRMKADCCG
jgi:hypothetical protein